MKRFKILLLSVTLLLFTVSLIAEHSIGPAPMNLYQGTLYQNSETKEEINQEFYRGEYAFGSEAANGFFSYFDTDTPEDLVFIAPQFSTGTNFANAGDFDMVDQTYVYELDNENNFGKYDLLTGAWTLLGSIAPDDAKTWAGMATNPVDGTMYAITTDIAASDLYMINPATFTATYIGPTGCAGLIAMAIDDNGDAWTYCLVADEFYSIDLATGATTLVGPLGFDANFGQGMTWDPITGDILMSAFNYNTFQPELRLVDTSTGSSTLMGVLGANTPGGLCQFGWIAIPSSFEPPVYCSASGLDEDEYISNVLVGDINNDSMWEGYADFTALSTTMLVETGYPITITGTGTYIDDQVGIWVDWNQNLDFYDDDPIVVTGSPGFGPYTATITPPVTALDGPTRMRIRLTWNTAPDPCGDDDYGEVEDYTINVVSGYCEAGGGNDEYIDGVEISDLSNLGTGYNTGYEDFTALSANLIPGISYDLTIHTGGFWPSDDYGLWVDWNDDFDFDDPDENPVCFGNVGAAVNIFNFQVPIGAPIGPHRARIRIKYSGEDCGDPCGITSYGEVEDYTFNVIEITDPEFSVTPDMYDFGSLELGESSDPVTFNVMNVGGGTLTVESVDIEDLISYKRLSNHYNFDLGSDTLPAELETGESITIDVTYAPETVGTHDAQMVIKDDLTRLSKDSLVRLDNYVPLYGSAYEMPDEVVEIGDGTATGQGLPVEPFYTYTYSQVIYLAEQIGTPPGPISVIEYHYTAFDNFEDTNDIVVFMGHTTKTQFDSTDEWIPVGEMTEVFNGTWDITAGVGWVTIILDTPFNYNGVDNLVIAVDENRDLYDSSSDDFYCTPVDNAQGHTLYTDDYNPDPADPNTPPTPRNDRNIRKDRKSRLNYLRNYIANVRLYGIERPTGFLAGNVSSEVYRGIEDAHIIATSPLGTFETYTDALGDYNMEVPVFVGAPALYEVTCEADGYLSETQSDYVYDGNTTNMDFVLDVYLVEPTNLMATGWDGYVTLDWSAVQDIVVYEDFEGGIPGDWPIIDNGGDCVWTTTDIVARTNYTGGSGIAATADSDDCGSGTTMDTELRTPEYPVTREDLSLFFRAAYNDYSGGGSDFFTCDISTDGGTNWDNLLYWDEDHDAYGREDINIDLAPYLAGAATYIIRWYYYAPGWDWYAQIDDVTISSDVVPVRALNGYNVYRGTESGVYELIGNTDLTEYTDNTVENGTEYFYAVTGTYEEGPYESPYSNEASAIPMAARIIAYDENFEEDDGNYTVIYGEWEWGELPAERYPGSVPSGTKLWGTDIDDTYTSSTEHVLETVPFDLSGESLIYLEFEHWYELYSTTDCVIGIDHDNDGVYVPFILDDVSGDSEDWEHYVFPIPSMYYTDYVKFAFILDASSNYSDDGWYIDDVMLYDPLTPVVFNEDVGVDKDYSPYFGEGLNITVTPGANIQATVNGDVVTYINTPEHWNGNSTAQLTIDDGNRIVVYDKEIEIIVNPVNDAPTIELPEEIHFDEDTVYNEDFTPYINDVDGDDLVLTVNPLPVNLEITIDGFNVEMTNIVEHWNGSEDVTFKVNDQTGRLIGQDIVSVVVDPVNDLPVVVNPVDDIDLPEDFGTWVVGDADDIFFDPDNDLDISVEISDPAIVTPSVEGTEIILTSILDMYTTTPLTLTITASEVGARGDSYIRVVKMKTKDSTELRDEVSDEVLVTIDPVNDDPIIILPDSFTFPEEGTLDADFTAYLDDVDEDELILTSDGSDHIDVAIVDFMVTFSSPIENWNGQENVMFTVNDQQGRAIATDEVLVIVTPVNDPPTIDIPDTFTFAEGGSITQNFANYVNDVDNDPLTLSVDGDININVEINGLNVTLSTFDPQYYGEEDLTFTIDDGVTRSGLTRRGTRDTANDMTTVIVTYVNDAPEYVGPTYVNQPEDFDPPYTIGNMNDLFVDIDPPEFTDLTFEIVSFNANRINAYLDVDLNLIIESVPDANGISTLRIRATDNDSYGSRGSLSTTQDISIDITPVNDPPELVNMPDLIEMAANSILFVNFEDNWVDVDDPDPVMTITSPPGFIEVQLLPGYDYRFRLSALGLFDLEDYITVTIDDGHGRAIDTHDILVDIAASEPPYVTFIIPNQNFLEDFDLTYIINLDECFADPDDEFLNYGAEVLTTEGEDPVIEAQVDGENGFWLGSSIPNWFGTALVRVDCWDRIEERTVVSQTVGVEVQSVNDAPEVIGTVADQVLDEDFAPVDLADLYTIFQDVDGDPLNFNATAEVGGIFTPLTTGDMLSLNSILDMYGASNVILTADDGHRVTAETDFMVTVNDVYDYPTWNFNIANGDMFIFDVDGELLDLTYAVDVHNQLGNTAPVGYELLPIPNVDEDCYDIIPDEDVVYGLIITPTGYQPDQWHILYPDQECILTLDGGAQVQVTLSTNMSPYIEDWIPDTVMEVNWPWYDYKDLDDYFSDPEGGTLTYEAIFQPDEICVEIEPGNTIGFDDVNGWTGSTDITVVAYDMDVRATASQTFTVDIYYCTRSLEEEETPEPEVFITELKNNVPNPFNPSTTIYYGLDEGGHVELTIYNMKGQKVKTLVDRTMDPGNHQVIWNGQDESFNPVGSGIYFCRMITKDYHCMHKMILMK